MTEREEVSCSGCIWFLIYVLAAALPVMRWRGVLHWSWWVTLIPDYLVGLDVLGWLVSLTVLIFALKGARRQDQRDYASHGKVRHHD